MRQPAFIEIWNTREVWRALKRQLLCMFRALQTFGVLHISMNAHWHMNQLLIVCCCRLSYSCACFVYLYETGYMDHFFPCAHAYVLETSFPGYPFFSSSLAPGDRKRREPGNGFDVLADLEPVWLLRMPDVHVFSGFVIWSLVGRDKSRWNQRSRRRHRSDVS